jgi:uncharacterized protein
MNQGDIVRRLRIYISSTDKFEHIPLYEKIVFAAKRHGIAGATVVKGIMGYGASSEIYTESLWELTEKTPLVVEIIDVPEKINLFLETIKPYLKESGKGHIVTMDETAIVMHRVGTAKKSH